MTFEQMEQYRIYEDEQVWERVQNICNYYKENLGTLLGYRDTPKHFKLKNVWMIQGTLCLNKTTVWENQTTDSERQVIYLENDTMGRSLQKLSK